MDRLTQLLLKNKYSTAKCIYIFDNHLITWLQVYRAFVLFFSRKDLTLANWDRLRANKSISISIAIVSYFHTSVISIGV